MLRRPPTSTLFPYRRSSDLAVLSHVVSDALVREGNAAELRRVRPQRKAHALRRAKDTKVGTRDLPRDGAHRSEARAPAEDRKSTRLNSSHGYISYAVFCLKK